LTDFRAKTANASRTWGLHRCTGKRVLDLRCGGGFFLYLLTQLGHEVLGPDIDEFPLFGDLINLFGVPHVVWAIEAFKALPDLGARFDYITAFATRFNRSAERDWYWGPAEWSFFVDDLKQYLAPGGQIFFSLNRRRREGDYYTPELREFFLSRGASVERDRIYFLLAGLATVECDVHGRKPFEKNTRSRSTLAPRLRKNSRSSGV